MDDESEAARNERLRQRRKLQLARLAATTKELRDGAEPRWERLRRRLRSERIDPADVVIATIDEEDRDLEFGIVLTRSGQAFSFELDWLRDEHGRDVPSYEDAWVSHWAELSDDRRNLYADDLELARTMFDRATEAEPDL